MLNNVLKKIITLTAMAGIIFTTITPAYASQMQYRNAKVYANWHESSNDKQLSRIEHAFYNYAFDQLKSINEKGGNTVIYYDLSKYTSATDQGLEITNKVINLLKDNHPEYFCWLSSTSHTNGKIFFRVSSQYRLNDDEYTVDGSKLSGIKTAISTANKLIKNNADKNDYDKIMAYVNYIADNNEYNWDAAANLNNKDYIRKNGGPWHLEYVFDGNDKTNVVCEGYSEAFQYLIDNSVFDEPIKCKTVQGTVKYKSSSGYHSWNVVTIGDKNYHFDLTSYDDDFVDKHYKKAFVFASQNMLDKLSSKNGYHEIYEDKSYRDIYTSYEYDATTKSLYTADELKISSTDYIPPDQTVRTPLSFNGTITAKGTYGDELNFFTITSPNVVTDQNGNMVTGSWQFDPSSVDTHAVVDKTNAGQTFKVRFRPSSDADSYKALQKDVSLTVDKKTITVKAADAEMTKGSSLPDFRLVTPVTGLAGTDTADDLKVTLSTEADGKTAGKYDITGTSSSEWYDVTVEKGTLTVKEKPKKKLTYASAPVIKVTYGDKLSTGTVTNAKVTVQGKTNTVAGSWSLDSSVDEIQAVDRTNADKKFKIVFTPSDNADDYDTLAADAALKVTKKAVTVKADDKTITEGDALNGSDMTFKLDDNSSLVPGDTTADLGVKLSTKYKTGSDAGSYQITGTSSSEYYDVTILPGTLTVKEKEKVTPAVTENPVIDITYGDRISDGKISGGKASYNGADVPGTFTPASSVNGNEVFKAGKHTVKGVFTPKDRKTYRTVNDIDITVNVAKKPVTVIIDDKTMTEGNALPSFTAHTDTALIGNNKASDLVDIRCSAGDSPAAGTYAITGTVKAGVDDYDVAVKNGTLTVTKKELTALKVSSAPVISVTYGNVLSSGKISDAKVADSTGKTVKGTWAFDSTVNVSAVINRDNADDAFMVRFTPDNDAESYKELTAQARIKLTKKAVTVKADDKTITEGDALSSPDMTFRLDDNSTLVSGDTTADLGVKLSTKYKTNSGAGSYQITGTSSSEYYDVTILPGTLTVKKADRPVQPDPKPQTKKDITVKTVPSVKGTYGDSLSSFSISGGTVTDADGKTVSGRWTFANGSQTVNKSTAGRNAELKFTPSDTASYNSITASVKPDVSKRKITVKADDIERAVGEKRTLTFKITNGLLVSGDTEADIDIALKSSDTSDTAGTYTITGSSSSAWYDVTVLNGTLTIKQSGPSGGRGNDTENGNTSDPVKTTYRITYDLNGGTVSGNPEQYNADTGTFTLRAPELSGYTFAGWTGSNGNTPQKNVVIQKGTTGNLYFVANWTNNAQSGSAGTGNGNSNNSDGNAENSTPARTEYYITYDYDGGVAFGNPGTYTENDHFILNNPFKKGYIFTGWTDDKNSTPVMSKSIPQGSRGDVRFTAHWRVDTENTRNNISDNEDTDISSEDDINDETDIPDIASKKSRVTKLSSDKRTVTMKFKKVSLDGYKVKYQVAVKRSTASKWNKSYTSLTKKTFKRLKKGTTYWVSVRPYIIVDDTRYFGKWSETKTVKTR